MGALTNCLRGLAVIAIIAASPVFIVFAVPFGCGVAGDFLSAAGAPIAIALTAAACVAALSWVRWRPRAPHSAAPESRPAKSLG